MKRIFFTLVILYSSYSNFAQLVDDFSDGDFTNNPVWSGESSEFIINANKELQLNAPDAGESVIYTTIAISDSCEWQFFVNLDFAPSNTNLLKVYLQSDETDLVGGKGYFLEVGETGNLDAFKFYRQDGMGNSILLGSFSAGGMANQPAIARVKVIRNQLGSWVFFADYQGGVNFNKELELDENTYKDGNQYFGFYCLYTATRKDKYFFDEISVKTPTPDTAGPELLSFQVTSSNSIDLFFNESLDKLSVENTNNFLVNNGIGVAASVFLDGVNDKLIHLSFLSSFQNFQNYSLDITGIIDLNGNTTVNIQVNFTFLQGENPTPGDILINEIMADPSPLVGLPEVEFIELFNNTSKLLSSKNLNFGDASTTVTLPDLNLNPYGYYILCTHKDTAMLKIFGKTIGLDALPSLNNTGDNLSLKNQNGDIIDAVDYSDSWYLDNTKKLGGWTLERINPLNECLGSDNWAASQSSIGGTPGKQNSIYNPAIDNTAPELINVVAIGSNTILVSFNEKIDSDQGQFLDLFTLSGNFTNTKIELQNDFQSVLLTISPALIEGSFYNLTLASGYKDCAGNPTTQSQNLLFALPAKPALHDLVINEILFNPKTGSYDFLEIYNRSDKVFDIYDLTIINDLTTFSSIKQEVHQLILPGEYLALSEEPDDIRLNYSVPDTAKIIKTDLPSFNDDKGRVGLYFFNNGINTLVDSFYYDDNYHYVLLDELEGVSLERIDFNKFLTGSSNWHSAASTSGLRSSTTFSLPNVKYSLQTSVVIVRPGGTGTPIKFISARFAPFPPSKFFMSALPSAFPLPKV